MMVAMNEKMMMELKNQNMAMDEKIENQNMAMNEKIETIAQLQNTTKGGTGETPAALDQDAWILELTRLASLKEAGILSEEEINFEKAKLKDRRIN